MSKYSQNFKVMVVKEYLEGKLGYRLLAQKYGIKAKAQIERWVKVYQKYGADGLKRKIYKKSYPVQFKLDVLKFMKSTGSSETDTALHFGLVNPPIIASWKKAFLEGGAEALDQSKGRPPMSEKAKNKLGKENEMTREQMLERENELLRLEVEYLKKLRAFQMNPEEYLEKHKQHYHSNSKKHSD